MKTFTKAFALAVILISAAGFAQTTSASPTSDNSPTTIRGCLQGERSNYILVEDKTGAVYVLKGVGTKLDRDLQHEVEVKGHALPGTVKTGVRPEKTGSNPADTVHGVDGVPFQVANPEADVRIVAKHCKAADAE